MSQNKIVHFAKNKTNSKTCQFTLSVPIGVLARLHVIDGIDLIEDYPQDMQHIMHCEACYAEYNQALRSLRNA